MTEPRLATVLTKRTQRVAWTALSGFALLMIAAFAVAGEVALRGTLGHSAAVIGALLEDYTDSTRGPAGVMPATLAKGSDYANDHQRGRPVTGLLREPGDAAGTP
jgi:hypothetical protein